ncbi:MAG: hypothetical protein ACM3VS_16295 [Candidatus Dadabacteria bacterium]
MLKLTRIHLLNRFIKHKSLTLSGLTPNKLQLQLLLDKLEHQLCIRRLSGVIPITYTITDKGIAEGTRLQPLL